MVWDGPSSQLLGYHFCDNFVKEFNKSWAHDGDHTQNSGPKSLSSGTLL